MRREFNLSVRKLSNGFLLTDQDQELEELKETFLKDQVELLYQISKIIDSYRAKSIRIDVV